MNYTPNGIKITKTGRLLIPCKFNEIKKEKLVLNAEVAIVAYGGRINQKKIGIITKIVHNEPFKQDAGNIEINLDSFEVTLINGKILKDVFSDEMYPFENGQFEDVLNYKVEK